MKRTVALSAFGALCALLLTGFAAAPADDPLPQRGTVEPLSISVLAFAPDGTLFLGDSKAGAVYAIETTGDAPAESKPPAVSDLETKIAARIGAKPAEVMIHDLAVHPVSQEIFLSVSTGRGDWKSRWELPNHVADANYLLTVSSDGSIGEFSLADVRYARVELPNPVATDKKHSFMKELSLRTDTITDIAYTQGTLFVAGLSNEEFASALWRVPLPFADGTSATTLEIYHGAHGAYETHAPIRTFVPYDLEGEQHIFAAYLCTPLSLFKVKDLETQGHLRGRTIAEFGSGNYPLDMVVAKGETSDRVIIANSNLPLIVVDTKDIAGFDGEIIEQPSQYAAGVKHLKRSGTGVQQLDLIGNDFLVLLQRMPNGHLDLA
ncbi:MAG: hypothetical protein AAGA81_16435, partial [Acidobacteriota bacterium]